jgi:hypothetical protein
MANRHCYHCVALRDADCFGLYGFGWESYSRTVEMIIAIPFRA